MEKVEELQQTLAHHIEEEEGDIWPQNLTLPAWPRSTNGRAKPAVTTVQARAAVVAPPCAWIA